MGHREITKVVPPFQAHLWIQVIRPFPEDSPTPGREQPHCRSVVRVRAENAGSAVIAMIWAVTRQFLTA